MTDAESPFSELANHLYVEVGWEVCFQLGGIYTVLRSKAPLMVDHLDDRYLLVGPYHQESPQIEFEETPMTGIFGKAALRANERGLVLRFGRWLVTGNPQVVLIDYAEHLDRAADFKYFLWKDHHIESGDEPELTNTIVFGYLVTDFLECLVEVVQEEKDSTLQAREIPEEESCETSIRSLDLPIIAQFHEWMAGLPVPEIQRRKLPVATLFHTHATLIGRYQAARDSDIYHHLGSIDPYGVAVANGIMPGYRIERGAAWSATVFTTLSDITALEAEHFIGRKPDLLLPNGLNIQRFSASHEVQNLHGLNKQKIHEFIMGHFFPSYRFDLEHTRYIFISGRYEYTNKGFNLFIEALARLNWRLRNNSSRLTVVAFIITRAATKVVSVEVVKSQKHFSDLRNTCDDITSHISARLMHTAVHGKLPELNDLLTEYDQMRLKRLIHARHREALPSICTHDMVFDAEDPILNQLRTCQLFNGPDDPVKVVFHPEFLNASGLVLPMDYDQFVRGAHLGVFPGAYEPWGYTPMECVAMGIPAITSDLSGFGTYLQKTIPDHNEFGIYVVERRYRNFHQSADQLTDYLERILNMGHKDRAQLRNRVESVSEQFDWKVMGRPYMEAAVESLARYRSEEV